LLDLAALPFSAEAPATRAAGGRRRQPFARDMQRLPENLEQAPLGLVAIARLTALLLGDDAQAIITREARSATL